MLDHSRELLAAGLEYLQARLALAGIEAKEALLHFAIILGLFLLALTGLLFGYLFFCIAVTLLLAHLLDVPPGLVILVMAFLHFIVAAGCFLFALSRLKTAVFSATLAELGKDQEWLSQTSK